jgi:cyclase
VLKKRVIAVLLVKQGVVVQSLGFRRWLPVGRPEIAVEFLNQWGIDEIVLLDIDATRERRLFSVELVRSVARYGFVPLTVGGGIRSVDDMKRLIQSGADKIAINAAALTTPELITQGAEMFGRQCVVISIDAARQRDGSYQAFTNSGRTPSGLGPAELARRSVERGAGEILVNSIDRDGARTGYDLELARLVASGLSVPVILCGGAGHPAHLAEGLAIENVSAVAAANFFHYTEHSVAVAKAYLEKHCAQPVRLETYANYRDFEFDADRRLERKSDQALGELRFEFHPKEVI